MSWNACRSDRPPVPAPGRTPLKNGAIILSRAVKNAGLGNASTGFFGSIIVTKRHTKVTRAAGSVRELEERGQRRVEIVEARSDRRPKSIPRRLPVLTIEGMRCEHRGRVHTNT